MNSDEMIATVNNESSIGSGMEGVEEEGPELVNLEACCATVFALVHNTVSFLPVVSSKIQEAVAKGQKTGENVLQALGNQQLVVVDGETGTRTTISMKHKHGDPTANGVIQFLQKAITPVRGYYRLNSGNYYTCSRAQGAKTEECTVNGSKLELIPEDSKPSDLETFIATLAFRLEQAPSSTKKNAPAIALNIRWPDAELNSFFHDSGKLFEKKERTCTCTAYHVTVLLALPSQIRDEYYTCSFSDENTLKYTVFVPESCIDVKSVVDCVCLALQTGGVSGGLQAFVQPPRDNIVSASFTHGQSLLKALHESILGEPRRETTWCGECVLYIKKLPIEMKPEPIHAAQSAYSGLDEYFRAGFSEKPTHVAILRDRSKDSIVISGPIDLVFSKNSFYNHAKSCHIAQYCDGNGKKHQRGEYKLDVNKEKKFGQLLFTDVPKDEYRKVYCRINSEGLVLNPDASKRVLEETGNVLAAGAVQLGSSIKRPALLIKLNGVPDKYQVPWTEGYDRTYIIESLKLNSIVSLLIGTPGKHEWQSQNLLITCLRYISEQSRGKLAHVLYREVNDEKVFNIAALFVFVMKFCLLMNPFREREKCAQHDLPGICYKIVEEHLYNPELVQGFPENMQKLCLTWQLFMAVLSWIRFFDSYLCEKRNAPSENFWIAGFDRSKSNLEMAKLMFGSSRVPSLRKLDFNGLAWIYPPYNVWRLVDLINKALNGEEDLTIESGFGLSLTHESAITTIEHFQDTYYSRFPNTIFQNEGNDFKKLARPSFTLGTDKCEVFSDAVRASLRDSLKAEHYGFNGSMVGQREDGKVVPSLMTSYVEIVQTPALGFQ